MAKNLSITVDFTVTEEAYWAFKGCAFDVYLEEEIAEQMYHAFKKSCISNDVSKQIIMLAQQINEQAADIMHDMKEEMV